MGRSTVSQLINRAKNQNEYNNSGVSSDEVWVDHFNAALQEMTDDLKLDTTTTIDFTPGTEEYDLPDDYYGFLTLNDRNNSRVGKRRNFDQTYPGGYWIVNKGANYALNLKGFTSPETFTLYYYRYPALLDVAQKDTQKPEISTSAENALVYKAISHALQNNNQLGQSEYFEQLYRQEVAKMNTANTRARG